MASQLPPILRYYDRLAAVLVLALLLISLIFLVVKGVDLQRTVKSYDGDLATEQPSEAQIKQAENAADLAEIESVKNPSSARLLPKIADLAQPNLATAECRLLCVKCARPIPLKSEKCVFCGGAQPKEVKIDIAALDTDGDGIPDVEEVRLKLNPEDPSDVDADADGDRFTNLEEFLAKTDMFDAKSHPSYDSRIALKGIEATKLDIRFTNKMLLPSTEVDGKTVQHYQATFVSVDSDGNVGNKALRVNDGDEIPGTEFIFVRYNELQKKTLKDAKGNFLRLVDVSTVDLKRKSDGKMITAVYWDPNNFEWPGDPLLEQRATLEFNVPNVDSIDVAQGQSFSVRDEKYSVLRIDADKKVVTIKNNATNKVFSLK